MSRRRTWMIGILGLLLPVALATSAYVISSWGDAPANSSPGVQVVNKQINEDSGWSKELMEETPRADDHGDRCSEPEHQNDSSCTSGSSGSGSNVSGSDDSGSGGSGKDGSGSGDSSPSGSGKDSTDTSHSGTGSGSTPGGSGTSTLTSGSDDSG